MQVIFSPFCLPKIKRLKSIYQNLPKLLRRNARRNARVARSAGSRRGARVAARAAAADWAGAFPRWARAVEPLVRRLRAPFFATLFGQLRRLQKCVSQNAFF